MMLRNGQSSILWACTYYSDLPGSHRSLLPSLTAALGRVPSLFAFRVVLIASEVGDRVLSRAKTQVAPSGVLLVPPGLGYLPARGLPVRRSNLFSTECRSRSAPARHFYPGDT